MKNSSPHFLLIGMLLGIVSGILLGGFVPSTGLSIAFIGDLFLQALFALVVPLVMSSMIVGIASLGDVRHLGSIGFRTVSFFMTTTGLAVLVGLILVVVIHPGTPTEQSNIEVSQEHMSSISERIEDKPTTLGDLLKSILTSLVPKNLFVAMAEMQILPLIVFALVFGGVLTTIGEKGAFVIKLKESTKP